jgi:hypothetical protein
MLPVRQVLHKEGDLPGICRKGLRRKKSATCLPGATSEKGILASNKRCHVQGVRGETGAAGLPGATGEKGDFYIQ